MLTALLTDSLPSEMEIIGKSLNTHAVMGIGFLTRLDGPLE